MDLEIDKVIDNGNHAVERIELNVIEKCNLHHYILTDTTYIDTTHVSNKLRHTYWFLNQEVIKGDKIIIYTAKGTRRTELINSGKNTKYIYYWNLGNSVWNNTGDAAILFYTKIWKSKKVI